MLPPASEPLSLAARRLPHLPLVLVHAAAGAGRALASEEQLGQHQAPHHLGQHLVQLHLGRPPATRCEGAAMRPRTTACAPAAGPRTSEAGAVAWRPDSQAGPSELALGPPGSWAHSQGAQEWDHPPGRLAWAEGQAELARPGSALVAGVGNRRPQSQVVDLGGLAAFGPGLCPGRTWAVAILFLVTARRALCSPCHFNPRVAPGERDWAELQTREEETPAPPLPAAALPLSSGLCALSAFHPPPLPCPLLTARGPQF